MNDNELLAFADLLVRHLASVVAAERGYVERPCPVCADSRPRGSAGSGGGPSKAISLAAELREDLVEVSVRLGSGRCATCHGGQRVWSRGKLRLRPLSDRELINSAAKESVGSGRAPGGDRPTG